MLDLIQGGRVKLIELGLLHQQLVRHVSADLQPYIQERLLLQSLRSSSDWICRCG